MALNKARAKAGTAVSWLFPNLDARAYRRARRAERKRLISEGAYESRLADLPRLGVSKPSGRTHVVIVPMEGPSYPDWRPAGGNFFYEISQSAREYTDPDTITIFEVLPGETSADWHERLIRYLIDSSATHVMAQIETDPNPPNQSTWDVFWSQLEPRWSGVFLGVMFDSAFRMITLSAQQIAEISDRFLVVDICMPMDGCMVPGRSEVGPVNMPISNESLAALDAAIGDVEKVHDVSFIGALYPYRVEMIEALRAHGVNVAVNPHRLDETRDFRESRTNQPTYIDYMRGLAQSKMTINFSVSSSLNGQQLKTRILEGSSMGCLVLTDDVDRSDRFWVPGDEVAYFAQPSDVPALVENYLADPERLARAQTAGKARARSINVTSFWGGIDAGLARRGLPQIRA